MDGMSTYMQIFFREFFLLEHLYLLTKTTIGPITLTHILATAVAFYNYN